MNQMIKLHIDGDYMIFDDNDKAGQEAWIKQKEDEYGKGKLEVLELVQDDSNRTDS
jgi:hypothetical protein